MLVRMLGMTVRIDTVDSRLKLSFGFNRRVIDAVKQMGGARYNPEGKFWTIEASRRNMIAIKRLCGHEPYPEYNAPIQQFTCVRPGMPHQNEGLSFVLSRRRVVLAFEPGTGKSLIGIEAIEQSGCKNPLWVSTKNALASTRAELAKWKCRIMPTLINYDQIPNIVKNWKPGQPVWDMIIWDEMSRLKNPSTKRFQAAEYICDALRTEHKNGVILGMTGSPAPKDPTDWWALVEICSPGWLPEGSKAKLASTLAVIRPTETADARVFNKILTWKDDESKCAKCGMVQEKHDPASLLISGIPRESWHDFIPCVNEVSRLADRLTPICLVRTKDVLQLPPQMFRPYIVEPTPELKRGAELLAKTTGRAVQALILMRELSDGFQYEKTLEQESVCTCNPDDDPPCPKCHGSGVIMKQDRKLHKFPTAKDDALIDLLEEFEDDERLIVYAAFQASVDRVVDVVRNAKWDWVRLDGRGFASSFGATSVEDAMAEFQNPKSERKIAWCGHPQSGGMGLTLTRSKAIVYYSLDHNLESFLQSKDRNYRIGTTSSTIIPLFHLPVDRIIWDKHMAKQSLMRMSMGELQALMKEVS